VHERERARERDGENGTYTARRVLHHEDEAGASRGEVRAPPIQRAEAGAVLFEAEDEAPRVDELEARRDEQADLLGDEARQDLRRRCSTAAGAAVPAAAASQAVQRKRRQWRWVVGGRAWAGGGQVVRGCGRGRCGRGGVRVGGQAAEDARDGVAHRVGEVGGRRVWRRVVIMG